MIQCIHLTRNRQFYKLSKSHHPDLHPDDPEASNRFVRISEAYSTLGSPSKRARYDRDLARSQPSPSHARSGSYSSASSPAGGRPASGLSRRRTQFRGPPPSFYRSGGWGAHGEKRGEAASQASHAYEAGGASSGAAGAGGTGPGGFSMGDDNDVPHFDRQGHTRTHSEFERTRHWARRTQQRRVRREEEMDDYAGASAGWGFVSICAVLLATAGIPVMMGLIWSSGREQGRRIARERES